ncbi:DUF1259 domain-containing protein [Fundidesulfovibrio terrae]|uniref:DUF1259 domain-containing protein n=1 Tax=Fundidesulfovibrio terrae TaxID=2922866 RepID=UPI001FAF0141|nr:DUF1259 domain-containing protein [Fundidesulfovibrio terrae]
MKSIILSVLVLLNCAPAALGQSGPWDEVEAALGRKGVEQGGVYKVAFPRMDLTVTRGKVRVLPGVALTSWMAFTGNKDRCMVMGDMALLDAEVQPVMAALFSSGIEISALHNHLTGTTPNILYLHFNGTGDPAKLAQGLRSALAATATPLGDAGFAPVEPAPDWNKVEKVLGTAGQKKGVLVQFSFPRKEPVLEGGMEIPTAMGMATAINMAMVGGKAEASGDFVLLAEEVNPVAKALLKHGIEVTAVHGHMLRESPRLFFMHFWGVGEPEKLARGLKAALDAAQSN